MDSKLKFWYKGFENATYWFSNNRSVVKGINKFKIPADSNNSQHNSKEQS